MKKLAVCMMLIMCVASANAQWSVTPEVGMNVTMSENVPAKIGFKAGAAVAYSFGDGLFSLQSGLYYVQRGTGEISYNEVYGTTTGEDGKPHDTSIYFYSNGFGGSYSYFNPGNGGGYESIKGSSFGYGYGNDYGYGYGDSFFPTDMTVEGVRMSKSSTRKDYLQLPVMARFNWKIGKDIRLHLAAGPYVAVGLGGREKWSVYDYSGHFNSKSSEGTANPFKGISSLTRVDWGATLNAGIEVKRFAFNIGYDLGLGKQYKYDDIGMKYHTVSFTVGYTF